MTVYTIVWAHLFSFCFIYFITANPLDSRVFLICINNDKYDGHHISTIKNLKNKNTNLGYDLLL